MRIAAAGTQGVPVVDLFTFMILSYGSAGLPGNESPTFSNPLITIFEA
jgi:hypothetical protein